MPVFDNLDELLAAVYRRHVKFESDEFENYYAVFLNVFNRLQEIMKGVDLYYKQYSSRKEFTGSHSDRLRISRPDEFDVDIVISVPTSDIVIENDSPGYVRLRTGNQFSGLPSCDNWSVNRIAYQWADHAGYLLRTKFTDWFKSVVARALNELPKANYQLGPTPVYDVSLHQSGPACTLTVKGRGDFQLNIDLVPALELSEDLWPHNIDGYRPIPSKYRIGHWLAVPKGARGSRPLESPRIWRVSLHAQEKRLISGSEHLRNVIRIMKKLRDTQKLDEIASYYIKTLFLQELTIRGEEFWRESESVIFKIMVRKLYEAVCKRHIAFFWNPRHNLIGHLHPQLCHNYELKLQKLVETLEQPRVQLDQVAKYLLNESEYQRLYNS